jgi:hypothetical protein
MLPALHSTVSSPETLPADTCTSGLSNSALHRTSTIMVSLHWLEAVWMFTPQHYSKPLPADTTQGLPGNVRCSTPGTSTKDKTSKL